MPKLYYCHDCLLKKTQSKEPIKKTYSKSSGQKWHFGQVGHGGKKTI